ncbi:hypothetical protein F511_13979 [Dorcoceras hygrometricum]|uniref:Uncharacterized protein n=1 Tax=Dorcoceras hygrometricum TaxID=472368 RepID=A0A2Z7ABU0_9LAMI|nr:hypothetical protein F511_13979 [Dorcoceras hygrometricum]
MESAVMTSAVMSSQSTVGIQQMRREVNEMKRRRAEESTDGLALMTSLVTSSQSADGLSPPVARTSSRKIQSRATVDPVTRFIQSTRYDGSSRELQYYASSRKDPDARKADVAKHCNQAQSIQSTKISAEDEFSRSDCRSDKSAAKKLTIYESWMSTAELNSNGKNDKKPTKEKDTISHTVAAVVHLWSLGVLTAAGCGIGSVHEVVRSNLLVDPSEVEEGEM